MAYVTRGMRDRMANDSQYERELRGMRRHSADEMVPVPFEWQKSQTRDAVLFPTYGWVPTACIAWERNGQRLPWSIGCADDKFLIARRFAPAA
jgi:hypothetical protein